MNTQATFFGLSTLDMIYEYDYYPSSNTKNNSKSLLVTLWRTGNKCCNYFFCFRG